MSPRGTVFLKEWEQRIVAERESVRIVNRCSFCPWTAEGTLAETRDAYLEHRLAAHTEVDPPRRRQRHRPVGQINSGRSLDDNIAGARAQGASTWAGDQ